MSISQRSLHIFRWAGIIRVAKISVFVINTRIDKLISSSKIFLDANNTYSISQLKMYQTSTLLRQLTLKISSPRPHSNRPTDFQKQTSPN